MRVLYLSPSASLGGAERALLEGIRALRSLEPTWPIGLISLDHGPLNADARASGVETLELPVPEVFAAAGETGRGRAATLLQLTKAARPLATYARELQREIRRWRPDVVHSNGVKTHVLGAWCRGDAPLVWHAHDYLSSRSVSARLLRHYRNRPAAVLANSRSVADDAVRLLGGASRVDTVYNPIDSNRFSPEGARLDLDALAGLPSAAPGVVRVGLVATFARWKGHDVFLNALAALPADCSWRGYIIGGPVYRTGTASQYSRDELEELVRRAGLAKQVGFTGFVSDIAAAYRSLDVVVHASTSPEPFGLSIAEAMACERAVVISEAGGAREVGTAEETCLAHPPGEVSLLSARISRLARDPSLRVHLGRAARVSVRERFAPERFGAALRAVYLQLAPALCGA